MRLWRSGIRQATALVAAVVAATALAACGGGGPNAGGGTPDPNATLRIMYGMSQSLNPADAPEPGQMTFSTWPVYDRLIRVAPDATYQPMLATKWTFTPDGKTLNLTLREGVTFSDGTPFDAAAVAANIEYYRSADKSTVQTNVAMISGVETVGDHEVAIELKKPTTEILSALSNTLGGIMMSPKAIESGDLASHPVGTGAYVIESFRPGEQAVYKRRTDQGGIWDPKSGKVAEVVISRIAGPDAKVNALKSGQIDLTTWEGDPSTYAPGQVQTSVLPSLNMVGMYFNTKVKPLDNLQVRQAINYAIDRDGIVAAFAQANKPQVQPWPARLPGFDEAREDTYPYDPEKAKQLLADAGYPDGVTIPGEFLISKAAKIDKAGETVQANLAAVGITINLRSMDILAQVTEWPKGANPGQFQFQSIVSIDPYAWLQRLFVLPLWNPSGVAPELVGLINGIDDPTISEADRAAKIGKAVDYATDSALSAPLWGGVGGLAAGHKVQGLDDIGSTNGGVADLRYISMTE